MKRTWTLVTILVTVSLVLGACAPAATPTPTPRPTTPPPTPKPRLKITVATDATWPPFEYVDETTKEIVGFDADLMKAIAEAAGFDYEFVNVAWDPLLAGMATGEYDAAISAMTITEERAKQWDFSEPYYAAGQLIAVRVDETTIKTPEDLEGKTAGAQIGTTGAIYIEEEIPGATLKTYDDISQAFLDLVNGQIDAVVADDPLVEAMVGKYSDVIWVGGVLTAEDYGIAVKKGATEILDAINMGLQAVKDQGVLDQLKQKWIAVEPAERMKITVATDATWPPFEYVDETTKEIVGFDADLMKAIAEAAGFDYEFVNVAWDPLLAGMATGEYDAAISAMTITEERAKQWDFSEPYYAAGQLIAVRVDETTIKTPEDLEGKTAGAQIGTTGAIYIEEEIPGATLKTYDDISQAFLDLVNGQIDAVVADDPLVEAMVGKYSDVIWVGGVLTAEDYGIAVKKGATEILDAINMGLQAVKDQGVLDQLKQKWIAVEAPAAKISVGQVTDMGGIDDKSFNATAWKGVEQAIDELGAEGKFLESQVQADYAKNIQQFIGEDLDLIVTVGFLLGVDTAKAAVANPEQSFAIVDYAYPDCWPGAEAGKDCGSDVELPNVLGLTFATDEAAFLAGYLAAGMSKTGKVATFGGIKIPTVTIFMRGLEAGVKYYNQVKGTNVEVLGWDSAADEGLFTGNFESTDDGRSFAESLMDEGADIVMPVAGPVGLGSAAACKERGTMLIGVDTDWFVSAPEFQETYLTSILKNMDVAVFNAAKAVAMGSFAGGVYRGTLQNDGVGIAAFHEYADDVPADLVTELDQIKSQLISGLLTVGGVLGS